MDSRLRRRFITEEQEEWTILSPSSFAGNYVIYVGTNGSPFTISSDGSYIEAVSNGKNVNSTECYINRRIIYNDIKNRLCRISWTIECDDPSVVWDATNTSGNITLGLYTQRGQLSGTNVSSGIRPAKKDITTAATFVGTHSIEFVPSELFSGLTQATWFGWTIGFRSTTNGLTIRITDIKFEVQGSYAEVPLYHLNVGQFTFPHYTVTVLDGNTVKVEKFNNTRVTQARFNVSDITANDSTSDFSNTAANHPEIWAISSGKVDGEIRRISATLTNVPASLTIRKANTTSHALGGDIVTQTNADVGVGVKNATSNISIGAVNLFIGNVAATFTNTYQIFIYNNGVRYI